MSATILVADDEPGITDMLAWELGSQGYEVIAVDNGALAVEQLREAHFDVVITDVRMPGLDGIDVLKAVKDVSTATEVIVMTAYAEIESAIECVRGGAFDLILKPFDVADLVAVVARAVERRDLRAATSLYQSSRAILASDEPSRLPEAIVDVAMRVMVADDVSLMLRGGDNRLYIAYSHGLPPEIQAETLLALGERIAGRVAASRRPALIVNCVAEDPRFADIVSFGRVHSSIVCPLAVGERLVGVLNISRAAHARPFRRHDLEKAEVLASQVLLALENRRLVQQMAASERLASVGQLAAGVAHEINNPGAYVLTNLSFLAERLEGLLELSSLFERGASPGEIDGAWRSMGGKAALDEFRDILADALDGAGRIRDIARDLQSLARAEGVPTVVDLNKTIRTALRIAAAELCSRARLVEELGAGVAVQGQAGRLTQVFINLLVNAAQAIGSQPGAYGTVTITSSRDDDRVVARVRDNGPGIAPADLPRIFEPFFTTKEAGQGTGLGLALSREIVRDHGGDIHVCSSATGAVFTVVLPAATEASPALNVETAIPESAALPASTVRVLFVDDEPGILRSYQRAFGKTCDVTIAESGRQAIAAMARSRFDLVVCDLVMPEVSGMAVFDHARRAHPDLCEAFIFVTGSISHPDVQQFVKTISNQVLEKPFDLSVLHGTIERVSRAKSEKLRGGDR